VVYESAGGQHLGQPDAVPDPEAASPGITRPSVKPGAHRKTKRGKQVSAPRSSAPLNTVSASPDPLASPVSPVPTGTANVTRRKRRGPRPFWVEAVWLVAVAMVIALVVHQFLFQAFFIPSGSMENTLHVGDRVLVNRLSYEVGHVQRGQIVVFNGLDSWTPEATVTPPHNPVARVAHDVAGFLGFAPAGETDFIKRVIGVPGDHVKCCDAQGRITVNGSPLNENYLYPGSDNTSDPFEIVVPPGRLWVEGDHRDISGDSRKHTGDPGAGTIPISKVVGRAFVVVWPVSHFRGLAIPASYHGLASAVTASGAPYGIGALTVLPVGLMRRRRRRRYRPT
jgi:signal peptidase I